MVLDQRRIITIGPRTHGRGICIQAKSVPPATANRNVRSQGRRSRLYSLLMDVTFLLIHKLHSNLKQIASIDKYLE